MRVSYNQSLFDISVQECGSIEDVFDIAKQNGLSITDSSDIASLIVVPDAIEKQIADYYKAKRLNPATDIAETNNIVLEGIDYWALEVDFVVQ